MMFLQYAIWGAWLPLLYPFLANHRHFDPNEIGIMFAVGAVGAIVAPFVAGQIADRYFATQKFLAISHIVGGVLVWFLASIEPFWGFLLFSLAYSLVYAPTLPLTNSISFAHLPDRDRDFGKVRVWGTIGWIVVGIGIGQWLLASHTMSRHDATHVVVSEIVGDQTTRQAMLSMQVVETTDGQTHVGTVARMQDGSYSVSHPSFVHLHGSESIQFDAADVASVRPMYASMVEQGREADMQSVLTRLQAGTLSVDAAGDELDGVISDDVLQERILAGQFKGMADAFRLSAVLGILMGIYCITLPNTPPAKGAKPNAAFEAISEVKYQPLLTLFLLAVPISCIHQFYFVHTAGFLGQFQSGAADAINRLFGVGGGGLMTIGQMTEIAVLAVIPLIAKKVGRKWLLAVGIMAYAVRMALFAYVHQIAGALGVDPVFVAMLGTAMHGLCFGCFIFVAFMVVDEETTPDVRASAQSLFNLVIIGVGIIVGSMIAGWVATWAQRSGTMNFTELFSVPLWAAVVCLLILLVAYPARGRHERTGDEPQRPADLGDDT